MKTILLVLLFAVASLAGANGARVSGRAEAGYVWLTPGAVGYATTARSVPGAPVADMVATIGRVGVPERTAYSPGYGAPLLRNGPRMRILQFLSPR